MTTVEPSISLEAFPHETVLAEGPSRRVVRYSPGPGDPPDRAVIAKFYRGDEGARTAMMMEAIHAAVARSGSPMLFVPRVLGYDADRKLLLQEAVGGARFDTLLAGPAAVQSLFLAGSALGTLHGLDAAVGPARRMGDHIDELIRPHPASLAGELPGLAERLDRIVDALVAADARWESRRAGVPIHRDVHPRQLFLDGHRVCLIDWDLCARGDGALDLGNFVAYLRVRCGMDDHAIDSLLHGYAASGQFDVLKRVPLYEAFTYMRLCCKRFRQQQAGWREECAALVARAQHCLATVS